MAEDVSQKNDIYVPEGDIDAGRVKDIKIACELADLENSVGVATSLKREEEIVKGVTERQQIKLDFMKLFEENMPEKAMVYVNGKGEKSVGILLDNTQGQEIGRQAKVLLLTKDNIVIKNGARLWADLDPNRSPVNADQIKNDFREALDASSTIGNHEESYSQDYIVTLENAYQDVYDPLDFFSRNDNKNMKIIIKHAMKIPEKYLDINQINDEKEKDSQMKSLKSLFQKSESNL